VTDRDAPREAPNWTPDMSLRADATDGQIDLRAGWLQGYVLGWDGKYNLDSVPFRKARHKPIIDEPTAAVIVAREFAQARVDAVRDSYDEDITGEDL
jgi:hypothetical protein